MHMHVNWLNACRPLYSGESSTGHQQQALDELYELINGRDQAVKAVSRRFTAMFQLYSPECLLTQ